ncbi:MAG: hypothetical protein RLY43_398 [Bacteroidota bacterium]|jgi:hypothetical protein
MLDCKSLAVKNALLFTKNKYNILSTIKEWDCQFATKDGSLYLVFNNPSAQSAFLLRFS